MPVTSALGKLKQEDDEFKASLYYILKKKERKSREGKRRNP
jgi:hypothetical protein